MQAVGRPADLHIIKKQTAVMEAESSDKAVKWTVSQTAAGSRTWISSAFFDFTFSCSKHQEQWEEINDKILKAVMKKTKSFT